MAKRHQQRAEPLPRPIEETADRIVAKVEEAQPESIPVYRRCPICWGRRQGVGIAYSTQGMRRYYKCSRTQTDMPPCGHTWTAVVDLSVVRIESRTVEISTRQAAD